MTSRCSPHGSPANVERRQDRGEPGLWGLQLSILREAPQENKLDAMDGSIKIMVKRGFRGSVLAGPGAWDSIQNSSSDSKYSAEYAEDSGEW